MQNKRADLATAPTRRMIWLVFALMSAAVALCLVWPLARRERPHDEAAPDLDFYTEQLADVQGDVARGHVAAEDADATRTEIARRLLQAARRAPRGRGGRIARAPRVLAAVAAVVLAPASALALYLHLGHPSAPDEPLVARAETGTGFTVAAAIPRIEAHLTLHPEDGKGFALLAPLYMRLGRFDDAAKAYAAALRTQGEDAGQRAALGQALVMAADGVVTADARAAFVAALADDPGSAQARFFLATAAEQDGDKGKALALWRALALDTPAEAPWRAGVDSHIAALTGQPVPSVSPPGGDAGAAIAALPADRQRQAIGGMVEGLAARLAQNGRDRDGWLRLIRAYKVLGEADKARTAMGDARTALAGDADAVSRVDALGHELGLGREGT